MDNCSISQNPAKSWEVGRGCALGFCTTEERKKKTTTRGLVPLNVKHLCKWLRISLAKQFQQIQAMGETRREKQSRALLTAGGFCEVSGSVSSRSAPASPRSPKAAAARHGSRGNGRWQVPCGGICLGMLLVTSGDVLTTLKLIASLLFTSMRKDSLPRSCLLKDGYVCKRAFAACAYGDIPTCECFVHTLWESKGYKNTSFQVKLPLINLRPISSCLFLYKN